MKTAQLILAFGLFATAQAMCPNSCSGRGSCGAFDKCECHQNWQGADCSLRTCPYELAWVDVGTDTNDAHYYAECANKGLCDRKTGVCKCFDGYEGKGCRRSACPNECSGHGTCEYIDEMIADVEHKRSKNYAANGRIASDFSELATSGFGAVTGNTYALWDAQKIQGCVCDANFEGADCAEKTCPRGDDPLTTQINSNLYSSNVMRQVLAIGDGNGAGTGNFVDAESFVLTFYDLYGGKWRTQAIAVDGASIDTTAANVQTALRDLPNKVMAGVQVYDAADAATMFGSAIDFLTKDRVTFTTYSAATTTDVMELVIEFADQPGSTGMQYLLEVDTLVHGTDGAQPVSGGTTAVCSVNEWTTNNNLYNEGLTQENAVCSNRGLCDSSTGDCKCFSGYRGLACQEQEALT
jgi:hypothetical protein